MPQDYISHKFIKPNSIESRQYQISLAKDAINQGIKQKAADAVDMKRVEMSVDWNNGENLGTDNIDSE